MVKPGSDLRVAEIRVFFAPPERVSGAEFFFFFADPPSVLGTLTTSLDLPSSEP